MRKRVLYNINKFTKPFAIKMCVEGENNMPLPLDTLLDFDGNSYEIVSAVIKRAQQLTDIRFAYNLTTLEESGGVRTSAHTPIESQSDEKPVFTAFREIFDKSVTYKIQKD